MTTTDHMKGKVAIVTGGSSGIGLETVEQLLEAGVKVVNGDLRQLPSEKRSTLLEAEKNGDVVTVSTDVTSWADLCRIFDEAYSRFNGLDYVFANAGVHQIGPTLLEHEVDESGNLKEPSHKTLDVNIISPMNTAKLACWHWNKRDQKGCIVITASTASFTRILSSHYGVSKHAMLGLARSLYISMQDRPVRVNAVAPSWTATSMVNGEVAASVKLPAQPPADVARAVVQRLFGDETADGQVLFVQGGSEPSDVEPALLEATRAAMPPNSGMTREQESIVFADAAMKAMAARKEG